MSKNNKNISEDGMWCPECGTPVKKGFFTCPNCGLRVRLAREISEKQAINPSTRPADSSKKEVKKDNEDSENVAETLSELIDGAFDNPKDN